MSLSTVEIQDSDTPHVPYHHGGTSTRSSRSYRVPPEQRPFIAWDGEGINRQGEGKPQSYVLFGCSTGDVITSDTHLHTFDILDFIIDVGVRNPGAFHVGFAFSYDGNMIVKSLHPRSLERLHKKNKVTLARNGFKYHIQFIPGKWFSVSRLGPKYDRKKNPHDRVSVRINDLFGFFTCSFVAAYEKLVGPVPRTVVEGKRNRGDFADLTYIQEYWSAEIECLRELADVLRRRLYGAGFRITAWHGPGALASYALRQHNMQQHKGVSPPEVREAAKYGYAGGRFEMFKLGRTLGPIYSIDINSAYPYGISRLPSLSCGRWIRRKEGSENTRIARFGIYRIRLLPRTNGTFLPKQPGPLFHRDKVGNISYPWILDGWYWSPEVENIVRSLPPEQYSIVDGWEYVDWQQAGPPFSWIDDMYEKRREWKAAGIASEYALKTCMASIYGKLAQRVGWNEDTRTAPTWHQLEWAGWVTSHTRAMLWSVMQRIPFSQLVAVETDGLYTTMHPMALGIENSGVLGGWEVTEYDELLYVQSGLAWLRKGDTWTCKRRGLDAHTFSLDDCISYLGSLQARQEWAPYVGETTRFVGLGAALNTTLKRHCVWETTPREISPGNGGKRVHIWRQCKACTEGQTALDASHDMSIRSLAYRDPYSHPHDIPWEGDPRPLWRDEQDQSQWLLSV